MPRSTALLKRAGPPAALVALAAVHIAYLYRVTDGWVVDDAFISFRYVENWVGGAGLTFNEGERVEGYTNFSWVLILAALRRIGLPLVATAQALGVLLSLGAVLLLFRLGVAQLGPRLGAVPALLYAVNHSLMTWSFGGLEVPLFLFLLVAGTYVLFVRRSPWAICLFAAMALTRPEGYLFALIAAPFASTWGRGETGLRRWLPFGVAALLLGAHLTFKLVYYGSLLPNTFYAKVGFDLRQLPRGLTYLGAALTSYGILIPASVLLLFERRRRGWRRFLLLALASYGAYVVYAGGDPLPGFRLALPLLPLGWLAVTTLLQRGGASRRGARTVVIGALLLNSAAQGIPGLPKGGAFEHFRNDGVADCGLRIGRWFQQHVPAGATLATNTAGSIPYAARHLRAIDMLGLTNATIAHAVHQVGHGYVGHERYDADYVLDRNPDYVLLCFSCATAQPCLPSGKALVEKRRFNRRYRRRWVEQEGFRFVVYERLHRRRSQPTARPERRGQ